MPRVTMSSAWATTSNCTELLDECIARYGEPEILNTNQGCQYTSKEWTEALERYGIRISMDGRGRCKDNITVNRELYVFVDAILFHK